MLIGKHLEEQHHFLKCLGASACCTANSKNCSIVNRFELGESYGERRFYGNRAFNCGSSWERLPYRIVRFFGPYQILSRLFRVQSPTRSRFASLH